MPLALDPKQYEELERHRTAWSESALQEAYAQARATKLISPRPTEWMQYLRCLRGVVIGPKQYIRK
jgi:hypothetical protein